MKKFIIIWQTRAKLGAALQPMLKVIKSVSQPFLAMALQRRHAQMVRNGASSHKIDYVVQV